jgi:ArsR family transcriptional regulator, arsenate/arsenite/antimonite-responsive transcriptional repressor
MELVKIHEALCEPTRLRLVHVLLAGPLCVCHFQAVLDEPQVKISKHLAYLRARGLVTSRREGNWMIYALPAKPSAAWRAQLDCLQASAAEEPVFKRDWLHRLRRTGRAGVGRVGRVLPPSPGLGRTNWTSRRLGLGGSSGGLALPGNDFYEKDTDCHQWVWADRPAGFSGGLGLAGV